MRVDPAFTTVYNAKSFDVVWLAPEGATDPVFGCELEPIMLGEDVSYRDAVRLVLAHAQKIGVKITKRLTSYDKIDRWFDCNDTADGVMSIYPHEHEPETTTQKEGN